MKIKYTSFGIIIFLASFFLFSFPTRASAATVGTCPLFPSNNIWNYDISHLPVHVNSANFITSIGPTGHLHPDFGTGQIGIPYISVSGSTAGVPVQFTYASESDPGPYPIPANAPIEGGAQSTGDRHVLVVNTTNCMLYELFSAYPQSDGSWKAGSGAVWNLNSNNLRTAGWTSADAAGLPILPGLVRYDEVAAGKITHALRFTVQRSQNKYLWPATHQASSLTDPNTPPMGLRLRLKASVDISTFSKTNQVILTALKQYGMINADNGSNWFISGAPDNRWDDNDLHALSTIPGSDFEVVDESGLQAAPNSAAVLGGTTLNPTSVVPTLYCFGSCITPTLNPQTTAIPPVPTSPKILPTSESNQPCAAVSTAHTSKSRHKLLPQGAIRSGMTNLIQLLLALLNMLLQLLGSNPIQQPNPTPDTPTITPPSPSIVPVISPSPC